jgi:hypothetical protein
MPVSASESLAPITLSESAWIEALVAVKLGSPATVSEDEAVTPVIGSRTVAEARFTPANARASDRKERGRSDFINGGRSN